jgi:hypothetical protein
MEFRHTPLRRGMQFGQNPLNLACNSNIFFFCMQFGCSQLFTLLNKNEIVYFILNFFVKVGNRYPIKPISNLSMITTTL